MYKLSLLYILIFFCMFRRQHQMRLILRLIQLRQNKTRMIPMNIVLLKQEMKKKLTQVVKERKIFKKKIIFFECKIKIRNLI